MERILRYMVCVAIVLISAACRRQELEEFKESLVYIPITLDWSQSAISPDDIANVSLYFFPEDGSDPYLTISGSVDSMGVWLPLGGYSILIFNDAVGDLYSMSFSNQQSYSLFSASASEVDDLRSYYQKESVEAIFSVTDRLAVWRKGYFEISSDLECCQCPLLYSSMATVSDTLLNLQPVPLTVDNTITVSFENLNSAMTIEGALKGSAYAANLSTNAREQSLVQSVYLCDFSRRVYDDESNPTDGDAIATLLSFGKEPVDGASYTLELNVVLSSGELMSFSRDVTDQVEASDDFNIIISLVDSTDMISLPVSSVAGFGVESWGDSENVNLM